MINSYPLIVADSEQNFVVFFRRHVPEICPKFPPGEKEGKICHLPPINERSRFVTQPFRSKFCNTHFPNSTQIEEQKEKGTAEE